MDPFILKLILSFIVGGLFIAFTIWVSEKFGSKIGGLLIGLPSTLIISLIFIAWTQDQSAAVSAIPIVPAAIAANSLFVVAFILLHKYGRFLAFSGATLLWTILTLPLVLTDQKNLIISLIIAVIFFTLALLYLRKFPHRKLEHFTFSTQEFLFRTIFAGSIVALAVFLGKILGPLWGGLFASFPAAFFSTLYLLEKRYDINFTSSVARTMPYGSMGNVIFAVSFFLLVPAIGMISGIIISYIISLVFAVLIYKFILTEKIKLTH